jgi:drug/metabolite transporter (DMT)-like permease
MSLLFGTNLVVSRFALGQIHPLVYTALRVPIAGALAIVWTLLRHRRLPRGRNIWLHGSVVGLCATAAPMALFISSLQYQSAGVTALCISLTPIVAMILAHFRLHDDRMTVRKVIGSLVSFAGIGLLLATGETGLAEAHWEGFVLVLIGVCAAGYGIVHVRKHLSEEEPLDIVTVRLVSAAIVTVPLGFVANGFDLSSVEVSGVIAIIYGAVLGTLIGFLLYSYLVARFGPTKATQSEYIVPIVTVTTGAIFLGENVSLIVITGMIVALSGIAMATVPRAALRRFFRRRGGTA